MASASILPPLPLSGTQRSPIKSNFLIPSPIRRNTNTGPKFSLKRSQIAAASSSDWEREESRWLREEQRWLREDQRWAREESRWRSERESLIREIDALRLKIEALERERPVDASIGRITEIGPRPALTEEAEVKEMIFEEVVRVSEGTVEDEEKVEEMVFEEIVRVSEEKVAEKKKVEKRKTLRMGSEGEEVRAMQEALLKLGFYSGEDDMEFSCFSTGTERAVKTWQASSGTSEDGVMTSDLLERLFMERRLIEFTIQGDMNGAPTASVSEITEVKETVIKKIGDEEVEASSHRVFLLGENRWEEPSRLIGRDKPIGGNRVVSPAKCLTCHGEGRLMCTECDGSGEPNIEPQFLEWVGEETKCPYCEGLGYTVCDVCEGGDAAARI